MNWTEDDLLAVFRAAGFDEVTVESQETVAEVRITPAQLARWFSPAPAGERPSYSQRLAAVLEHRGSDNGSSLVRAAPGRPDGALAFGDRLPIGAGGQELIADRH